MTGEAAARVAAYLKERYPGGDVRVMHIPGGLQVEVYGGGSHLFAIIQSEHSAVLAALGASAETAS